MYLVDWYDFGGSSGCSRMGCGSCYGLWRVRNLACFEGKLVDAGIAAIAVVHEVQEYQKVRASLQTRDTSLPTSASAIWQFPPRGKAELNVDADQGSGGWTRGVVIQNDEGSVLAAVERTWGWPMWRLRLLRRGSSWPCCMVIWTCVWKQTVR